MLTEEIWKPSTAAPYRYPKGKCMHAVRDDEHCVWKLLKGTHVSSAADSSEETPREFETAEGGRVPQQPTLQLRSDLPAASHVLVCWGLVLIRSEFTVYHELEDSAM
ncbi:small integral membrane protein 11 isoform X3 [Pan paniscus]|uniref:small integral membrane protein 11 isoform X3 n=1 Tax=Pan paniscus TaxID=9597 RepID=UPI001561A8DD